jgi:hypothetical protein
MAAPGQPPLGDGAAAGGAGSGAALAEEAAATKARLESMTSGLDDFAALLKAGNRQRRELDEHRIAELKAQVFDLERGVGVESERRAEGARALQSWAESQVAGIRSRVDALLEGARADMAIKQDALHARIAALEAKFEADCARVMADVKKRNEDLVESLRAFAATFEAERAARMEREQRILDRLARQEHESARRADEERATREQAYMATRRALEESVAARVKADDKFQEALLGELAALKNAVAAEEGERAREDGDIAAVLHRYVAKLQASLAIMTSADEDY